GGLDDHPLPAGVLEGEDLGVALHVELALPPVHRLVGPVGGRGGGVAGLQHDHELADKGIRALVLVLRRWPYQPRWSTALDHPAIGHPGHLVTGRLRAYPGDQLDLRGLLTGRDALARM